MLCHWNHPGQGPVPERNFIVGGAEGDRTEPARLAAGARCLGPQLSCMRIRRGDQDNAGVQRQKCAWGDTLPVPQYVRMAADGDLDFVMSDSTVVVLTVC
ncbi:hypothetical protein SAV14893_017500 [Streptomyces avermitilis]|uniref:Uncharacterized protein n=1 Tax=Streptomyces avermitilis TaxID=33903 RepID=A0A4D4LW35_STRAX|nr:hypothetical protein SAVMC3_29590 [Streptomyces avermitilis]GDY62357.1 hypothetical protein SAV14893_017500 [Streptomyces avermitilis]GDY77541.1 hypothetical protein SAV31267_070260 [Streptomyces avermitilis]GDY86429.1 hypothetical protein SAVCW2_56280 [Streptomyces avermitilis]